MFRHYKKEHILLSALGSLNKKLKKIPVNISIQIYSWIRGPA
jgi:hypothetical protein